MFQFYATGYAHATDPFEVGRVIHHAITTDDTEAALRGELGRARDRRRPRRRCPTRSGWRSARYTDDADYYAAFKSAFGLDIARPEHADCHTAGRCSTAHVGLTTIPSPLTSPSPSTINE